MALVKLQVVILTLSILVSLAKAQFVSSLPDCVRDCIDDSQDENCKETDIKCLCRASAGNFLTDTVICIHNNCDNDLDNDLLLAPLQLVCQLAGTPIPDAAMKNAEDEASLLATQGTVTVTMTSPTSSILSTATVTTTIEGSTFSEVYPVTIGSSSTASGSASTIMTNSVTRSTSSSSTKVPKSTVTSSVVSTSTIAAGSTSNGQSFKSSATSSTAISTSTSKPGSDSAPFTNTNNACGKRLTGGWVGFSALLVAGCIWYF